ncbi:tRNA-specific adenosine deaminase [Halobacillus halophilus]|uniref:Guanine/cytidine deaminase n=1 Tax=Halobacillus halophilus (strain ATCC 35676 / DSM 2266 / JCM 20832 / KCTC 3685 / LMG 17431 / NBRC 102448 / NCIMB 2269) TaxID=866895 RepID=I0JJ80_HALH3|nr:nucleoside deaminase [Halobacillus halophilus]ASF38359.1 tRNA-specific adenosine deaminase [Halobacillus halophilus]CCG44198.1 putative guanine/cytidine deaminase [Halobacillus halophilus DSM 2266]
MNEWMEKALKLAVTNVREGGHPFGAVLVKDGEAIAEGVNELHIKPDVSAHAELVAIRKAQEHLRTTDLSDCTLYASGEPCPMCLTAAYFAGIKEIHFAQTVEEASRAGLSLSGKVYEELTKPKDSREINFIHEPVQNSDLDAMDLYSRKTSESE